MTLLNLRKEPAMPKVASAPMPSPRPPVTKQYHEDALRFGQQIVDLEASREALQHEIETERGRRISAESEVERLKAVTKDLEVALARKTADLENECDHFKTQLTVLRTMYTTAAKILLDGQAVLDVEGKVPATPVNMQALAEELSMPDAAHAEVAQSIKSEMP